MYTRFKNLMSQTLGFQSHVVIQKRPTGLVYISDAKNRQLNVIVCEITGFDFFNVVHESIGSIN
jgi:hypothetical protein